MAESLPTDEQIAKRAFEVFYLKDVKGGDGPVPWGHSWIESRWKFWWAAWQAAQHPDVGAPRREQYEPGDYGQKCYEKALLEHSTRPVTTTEKK